MSKRSVFASWPASLFCRTRFLSTFLLVAGYSWQACWLFECLWQLLFLVQMPVGMVACLVCLLGALASMLYALSRLYA